MNMFTRLFLLLGLVTGVSLAVVAGLLYKNSADLERRLISQNQRVGENVVAKNTDLVQESVRVTHRKIVREKAKKLETFFAEVARAVELDAGLAAQCLDDPGDPATAPPLFHADEVIRRRAEDLDFRTGLYGVK